MPICQQYKTHRGKRMMWCFSPQIVFLCYALRKTLCCFYVFKQICLNMSSYMCVCVGYYVFLCMVTFSLFLSTERNNFRLSTTACLHMLLPAPRAAGPPSMWRVMQLRQIPAGILSLMPTGRSQALDTPVVYVGQSMCMSYCLENFICMQTQTTQMPGSFQEHWPPFTSN